MGAYVAAMFHLMTHAFFKALLFLSAGSVIHGVEHGHHHVHEHGHGHHDQSGGHDHDESEHTAGDSHEDFDPQDMRNMGGLRKLMPVTFWVYMIGTLALAGFFPFAGFWSKDEILAHAANNPGWVYTFVYYGLVVAAIFTAFYMGRQIKMVFFGKSRSEASDHAVESSPTMTRPLVVLAFLTVFAGLLNLAHFTETSYQNAKAIEGEIQLRLEHWLEHSIESFHLVEEGIVKLPKTPTVLQLDVAILSTILALAAIFLAAFVVYRNKPEKATDPDPLERTPIWWMSVLPINTIAMKGIVPAFNWLAYHAAFTIDWRFWHDWFHNRVIRDGFVGSANWLGRKFDTKAIDGGLVHGTARLVRGTADAIGQLQSGYVRNYALAVFLGVVAILTYFIYSYFAG
jgi:NADH-quinone oxidoreductase subunit L